jgi:glycosyltransferase involved in cell wall biosynthesis
VHLARLGGYYKLDGYRHAHAWVGNTRGICDYLVRSGFPAHRVFHIYNFLELPAPVRAERMHALRSDLGVPQDAWVLLTVGRLVAFKGHRHLVEALAHLPQQIAGRPVRLVVLGDGPLRVQLRQLAQDLGVADRVLWAGWQTDPGPFYRAADLVVFPSLEREPFGNVVLEAWAYGKPLVTTRFRGAMEFVRHGEDVWQVACGDADGLAAGIRRVLEDATLAEGLARRGLERVQRDFGRTPIMERYTELYEHLIRGIRR